MAKSNNNNNQSKSEWNFAEELAKLRQDLINKAIKDGEAKLGGTREAAQPLHLRKVYKKVNGKRIDTGRRAIKLGKHVNYSDWGAYKGLQFKSESDAVEFINKAYTLYNNLVKEAQS